MQSSTQLDNLDVQVVHTPGITRVAHVPKDARVDRLITAGDDFLVRLLPTISKSSVEPLLIQDSTQAVTWIEADHQYLVTSSEDGCVRLYRHNSSNDSSPTQLYGIIRRETLPVRCAAIERAPEADRSPRVAVCSDELIIRLVDVADPRKVQLLTGHSRGIRSASWSPVAPILVTCSADASARVWDLSTNEPNCLKVIDGILPPSRPESEVASYACWHPSGSFFVLPSKAHELVVISAQTSVGTSSSTPWIRTGSFVAGSYGAVPAPTGSINSMAFCYNGRYLAVGTGDGQVTVWETSSKQAIRAKKAESLVTGLSWHPTQDALAWVDNGGTLTRWSDVVGSTYPSPCEEIEFAITKPVAPRRPRDEVDDLFDGTGVEDDDMAPPVDDVDDFVVDDGQGLYSRANGRRHQERPSFIQGTKPQEPFQPTSTPMQAQRRYLSYNLLGSVTAVDQDSHQTISFDSYDTAARRNYRFTDHNSFSMASLGQQGVLFASKQTGENPSIAYFKPFDSWNSISAEWTVNMVNNEDVEAVALGGVRSNEEDAGAGQGMAVIATSKGYLRFFSTSGMQVYLWALGHPVVAMAAGTRSLIVIYRSTGGALDGHQNLGYSVIDLTNFDVLQEGLLPLAKDTHVRWVGFNDYELPAIYDSNGVLFVLDRAHRCRQGRWVPALDTGLLKETSSSLTEAAVRAATSRNYWPVAVTSSQLMVLFLRGGKSYPEIDGARHLIQEVELQIPLINRESGTGSHEEKGLRDSILASMLRDARNAGLEASSSEALTLEMSTDKSLLQLIQLACKADRHARALDAAKRLHSTRTLDAALQIAAFFHLPSLAERLTNLKEDLENRAERVEEESRRWCDPAVRGGPSYTNPPYARIAPTEPRTSPATLLSEDFARTTPRRSYGTGLRLDSEKENIRIPEKRLIEDTSLDIIDVPKPKANPFARNITRDKSMHKSTSFFERVDEKEKEAPKTSKQSTLLGFTKQKTAPAFGEMQLEESLPDEESIKATLEHAERPTALEQTQYPEEDYLALELCTVVE